MDSNHDDPTRRPAGNPAGEGAVNGGINGGVSGGIAGGINTGARTPDANQAPAAPVLPPPVDTSAADVPAPASSANIAGIPDPEPEPEPLPGCPWENPDYVGVPPAFVVPFTPPEVDPPTIASIEDADYSAVRSTHIGGRNENQDSYGWMPLPGAFLVVVCDGMGGGPGGKTASSVAVRAIGEYIHARWDAPDAYGVKGSAQPGKCLRSAVEYANAELRRFISCYPDFNRMGTTVTAVIFDNRQATIAHVGDSRIYQLRGRRMVYRSADHSKVAEIVRMRMDDMNRMNWFSKLYHRIAGILALEPQGTLMSRDELEEQARLSAYSNIITRAVGVADSVEVDIDIRPYEKNDRFVLCSDGIWGAKEQKQLIKLLTENTSLRGTLDAVNAEVEAEGQSHGNHHDNYTAIIVQTLKDSSLKETMSKRTKLIMQILGAVCALSLLANIIIFSVVPSSGDLRKENSALEEENSHLKDTIEMLRKEAPAVSGAGAAAAVTSTGTAVAETPKTEQPQTSTQQQSTTQQSTQTATTTPAKPEAGTSGDDQGKNAELQAQIDELQESINKLQNLLSSIQELQNVSYNFRDPSDRNKGREAKRRRRSAILESWPTVKGLTQEQHKGLETAKTELNKPRVLFANDAHTDEDDPGKQYYTGHFNNGIIIPLKKVISELQAEKEKLEKQKK